MPTTDQPTWIVFSRLDGRTIHHCKRLEEALALKGDNWALLVDQHVDGDDDGPAY